MDDTGTHITGGCLCGALRYEADAEPLHAGFYYCDDCRRASGSGCIPSGLPAARCDSAVGHGGS